MLNLLFILKINIFHYQNIIYDLKVVCPRLDRYWYFDHLEKANTLKHAQESESKSFMRSVGKSQID